VKTVDPLGIREVNVNKGTKPAEAKKAKSLYFLAQAAIALPATESRLYAALAAITELGFRTVAGPLGIMARFPAATREAVEETLTELGGALKAQGFKLNGYTISEVFIDSGSFDTLKILETPPHADKPSAVS